MNIFNAIVRTVVAEYANEALTLIEGHDLLSDLGGLTSDLTPPSDVGHHQIAENLANRIQPVLAAHKI